MIISGFTFVHNGVNGGYPFVEAIEAILPYVGEMVVVNMACTDKTIDVIKKLSATTSVPFRILPGKWVPGSCEEGLDSAYYRNSECLGDVVWFVEADEVFSPSLAAEVYDGIMVGHLNIGVYRIQVEQNFQRARWYPDYSLLRVFERGKATRKGHTGVVPDGKVATCPPEYGLLWDVCNCFRDNWRTRIEQNAELWGELPQYRVTPYHFTNQPTTINISEIGCYLKQDHWTWHASPFDLPESLVRLVGMTDYSKHLSKRGLL